jgi:hypothetical protein
MPLITLLIELDLLPQRTMQLLLESVQCDVFVLNDEQALPALLKEVAFDVIVVSTLGSVRAPLLAAEQSKKLQPLAHLLLWGPSALGADDCPYVDKQLMMPSTLSQLDRAIRPN